MTPSHRLTTAVVALLLATGVAACSSDSSSEPGTKSAEAPGKSFALRPVLAQVDGADAAPTEQDGVVLPSEMGAEFLDLGPAALDEDDVEGAVAHRSEVGDWVVTVDFKEDASTALADVTGEAACAEGARNRIALIVDDDVVSSPTMSLPCGTSLEGSTDIAGAFSQEEADTLARRIAGR